MGSKIPYIVWEEDESGVMKSRVVEREVSEERLAEYKAREAKTEQEALDLLKEHGVDTTSLESTESR